MKTLEELLAELNQAKEALAAKPDDKTLADKVTEAQAAYDAKKAEEEAKGSGNPEDLDESKLDESTKKYLAKLRKENASHRTKAKELGSQLKSEKEKRDAILKAAGIEIETERPEDQVKTLKAEKETMLFRAAILESALEHGISSDGVEFFEFLVAKATSELEEGEELSDDKLKEIVSKVKKQSGGKGPANSTVTGDKGTPPPENGGGDKVDFAKFIKMNISEKSALYLKNPTLYNELAAEAKAKKKLVG